MVICAVDIGHRNNGGVSLHNELLDKFHRISLSIKGEVCDRLPSTRLGVRNKIHDAIPIKVRD